MCLIKRLSPSEGAREVVMIYGSLNVVGIYSQIFIRVVVILNSLLEKGHVLVVKQIGICIISHTFGLKILTYWVCLSFTRLNLVDLLKVGLDLLLYPLDVLVVWVKLLFHGRLVLNRLIKTHAPLSYTGLVPDPLRKHYGCHLSRLLAGQFMPSLQTEILHCINWVCYRIYF